MKDYEFKLPDVGEGVAEGEIVRWHVAPGDRVDEDAPMVEVMTDKATVTIGAPKPGRIRELRAQQGAVVRVGEVIVVIEIEETPRGRAQASAGVEGEDRAASAVGDIREGLPGVSHFAREKRAAGDDGAGRVASTAATRAGVGSDGSASATTEAALKNQSTDRSYFTDKPLATPATRKLARELGVDLRRVSPGGEGGRVLKDDVRAHADHGGEGATPGSSGKAAAGSQALERREPFVGIRRRIAERMQTATRTAAHFTFVEECDAGSLKALRERLQPAAQARGVELSYLPFVVKAVVASLQSHPVLNSTLDEAQGELVYRHYYHIGVATATDRGLMVPVVRDADRMGLLDIAREIERLSHGAREGTLEAHELRGSTFTVTSLGKQGGLFATPVLNFPEVGILGVHRIKQKPVVRDGQIVIGDEMMLSLSFDHRIVDGHVGAAFAYEVIAHLEAPERLML